MELIEKEKSLMAKKREAEEEVIKKKDAEAAEKKKQVERKRGKMMQRMEDNPVWAAFNTNLADGSNAFKDSLMERSAF